MCTEIKYTILQLNWITAFTIAGGLVNPASIQVEPTSGGGLVNPDYNLD